MPRKLYQNTMLEDRQLGVHFLSFPAHVAPPRQAALPVASAAAGVALSTELGQWENVRSVQQLSASDAPVQFVDNGSDRIGSDHGTSKQCDISAILALSWQRMQRLL